ncbi:MAG: polysaccharide biosynthesis C-terminal domain-containing protein, partial [Ktedonobacterales bacterium]
RLLYGKEYAPSAPILVILSATLVPMYLNILVNQFLVATDSQIAWTKVMAAACVFNPLLNFFLIGYYQRTTGNGAFGAAIALFVTEALMMIIGIVLLPKGVLGASNFVTMLKSGLAAGIMGLGVFYTRGYFILVPIAFGTALYFVSAFLLRVLPKEDFAMVSIVVNKVAAKLKLNRLVRPRLAGAPATWWHVFGEDLLHWQRAGFGQGPRESKVKFADALTLWWSYPGVRATLNYRLARAAHLQHIHLLPGMLHRRNVRKYGLDILPSVPIGPGLYIPHPVATVVAARKIGANVSLISGITIGMRNSREFPIIGDNVTIGTGARVLGGVAIGDNALIGANAVVTIDVPANSTAVGIPARILKPHSAREVNEALRCIPDAAAAGTAPRYARKALRVGDSSEMPAIRLHSSNGASAANGSNGGNGAHGNGHLPEPEAGEFEEFEDDERQELVTTGERIAFTIVRRPASGS